MDVVWIKCDKCGYSAEAGFNRQYCTHKGCENYDEAAAEKVAKRIPERYSDDEEDTRPLGDNQDWVTWTRSACTVERIIDPPSRL